MFRIQIETLFTLFRLMNSRIRDWEVNSFVFESQKAVNSNVFMCEKRFVRTKNYSNRRQFQLWKKNSVLIKVHFKNFDGGGGGGGSVFGRSS